MGWRGDSEGGIGRHDSSLAPRSSDSGAVTRGREREKPLPAARRLAEGAGASRQSVFGSEQTPPSSAAGSLGRPSRRPRFLSGCRAFVPVVNPPKPAPSAPASRESDGAWREPGQESLLQSPPQSPVSNHTDFLES